MSYSGVRRSSVLGEFGRFASTVVSGLLLVALFAVPLWHLHYGDNVLVLGGGYLISLVVAIAMHEAGHLVVGLAVGEPARQLRIGTGATLVAFRVGGVLIQICMNPLNGGATYFSSVGASLGPKHLVSLTAGPGVNLLATGCAFALWESGVTWLGVFALAHASAFILGAVPSISIQGGRQHKSDGLQILEILLRPPRPAVFFDGAELSDDAHIVLVRAMESAQLGGRAEVTEDDLLRALAQDPAVRKIFKSAGVETRIPSAPEPESDEMQTPHLSPMSNSIVDAAFHKSRDLGNPRPNPAGLCLGLLTVESSASRLLKDAGISEDTFRSLAAMESKDAGAMHREQVISADLPLERWGTAADAALARAYKIAEADRSTYVGTQHILAAIEADSSCRGAQSLARTRFALVWKPQASSTSAELKTPPQLSVQAAMAIAGSLWRTGQKNPTGTAELCLGIVDQNAGIGAQLLLSAGVTADALIKAIRLTEQEVSQTIGCTPAIRQLWERRAFARLQAERWTDCRNDFLVMQQTATTDLQRALAQNNVAWASLLSADPSLRKEALELTRAAIAVKPDLPNFIGTHAFALLENGSPAEATTLLESVANAQPRPRDRASDLCLLAMCYARTGRADEAIRTLAAAEAADPKCALITRARVDVRPPAAVPVG